MEEFEFGEYKLRLIPEISGKRVKELYKKIKPIVRFDNRNYRMEQNDDGIPYFIEDVDPFETAFTWGPKPTKEATNIELFLVITTFHKFGAPALFKPSIAEVFAQIPTDIIDKVVAFETLSDNLSVKNCIGYYHFTHTKLYKKRIGH